jgi:acetolactate synthase I/II/III large subunit
MKAADYLVEYLYSQGVTQIFEVIGGMVTLIVDSVYRHNKIELVSMHHEQAASFAADAFGRISGKPGIALATSGPGATNLITGIGSCYFDSIPAIFITGQVNVFEQKGTKNIRQLGFQETDIVSMVKPITKASWKVNFADELPNILRDAFSISTSGRPGPVLIDIPMNIQKENISSEVTVPNKTKDELTEQEIRLINDSIGFLRKAKRPLVLAGGGIRESKSIELFRDFIKITNVPSVNTLLAVDALPFDDPQRVGLIGTYGNRWANTALGQCDLLLVLGSRLDIRQTGADTESFKKDRKIIHVDCEISEINNRITGCSPIVIDLQKYLRTAIKIAKVVQPGDYKNWVEQIDAWKKRWPDVQEIRPNQSINPNSFLHELSQSSPQTKTFVVDVGNHQMWAAQSIEVNKYQRFITSAGMGSMGYALPAAIGACYSNPGKPVMVISGDGGLQMNIQEFETIVHHHLPIKIVVINNKSLGMVRQFQESYYENRLQSTLWGYSAPDFSLIANAYGISSSTIGNPADISKAIKNIWEKPLEPFLLQVMIDKSLNAYPKIAFGRPITEMEPFVKPIDMEST